MSTFSREIGLSDFGMPNSGSDVCGANSNSGANSTSSTVSVRRKKIALCLSFSFLIVYALALFVLDVENFIQTSRLNEDGVKININAIRMSPRHYRQQTPNSQHGYVLSLAKNASVAEIVNENDSKKAKNNFTSRGKGRNLFFMRVL
jgi:hypothetical protein